MNHERSKPTYAHPTTVRSEPESRWDLDRRDRTSSASRRFSTIVWPFSRTPILSRYNQSADPNSRTKLSMQIDLSVRSIHP